MSLWQKVCFLIAIVLHMSPCIWYIYVRVWGAIDSATQAAAESSLTFPPDISIVSLVASHVFPCDARWERKIKRTLLSKASMCLLLWISHNGYSNEYHILTWYKKCVVWSNWSLLWTQSSSELPAVKMAPILSRPLGRLLIPTLSRAMSSGYLVHEPKYSFLKVKISVEMMLVM